MGMHQNNLFCLWNSCTTLTPRTSHPVLLLRQLEQPSYKKKKTSNISVHSRVSRTAAAETSSSHSDLFLLRNEATLAVLRAPFSTSPLHILFTSLPFHPALLSILQFFHQLLLSYIPFQPLPRAASWEPGQPAEDGVG